MTARNARFKFRLFVAGGAQNSTQAISNLAALCRDHLPGRHHIEIVDVLREPQRALKDGVFMTPTLVRLTPGPTRRIVGCLSQKDIVLKTMGMELESA